MSKDNLKYFNELEAVARRKSLEFDIKTISVEGQFFASVTFGNRVFKTYPKFGAKSDDAATEVACKMAKDDMLKEDEKEKEKVQISTKEFIEFVLKLLQSKEHGYWSTALKDDLGNEKNAILPQNWFEILSKHEDIIMTLTQNGAKCLLYSKTLLKKLDEGELVKTWVPGPEIPNEGEYFEVIVPSANAPDSFTLQPWQQRNHFKKLMNDMQYHYNVKCQEESVERKLVKVGMFFACRYGGSTWFRVFTLRTTSSDDSELVSIYLIDFGITAIVPISSLRTLRNEFRTLPYMAIVASLHGVEPIEDSWTEESCNKFETLVSTKEFVSVIKEKWVDDKLGLPIHHVIVSLVDTSNEAKDTFIAQQLIEQKACKRKID